MGAAKRAKPVLWREDRVEVWVDAGRLFVQEDGAWLDPVWVSERFERLVKLSGLPQIRRHDPRHRAATLMPVGGAGLKVVQDALGHSTSTGTVDTGTTVLPEVARVVPRAKGAGVGLTSGECGEGNKKAPRR